MNKLQGICLAGVLLLLNFSAAQPGEASRGNVKQIGFEDISLPDNISNDEFAVKAIYFAVKEEAVKRLKKIKINYDGSSAADDAYISGNISTYELKSYWNEPHVATTRKEVWSKSKKWHNSKNEEKTMTITRYEDEPYGVPGGYSFIASVSATLNLVDAKTGAVLVSYSGHETNDKEIDAFYDILKDFYKKVNKEM